MSSQQVHTAFYTVDFWCHSLKCFCCQCAEPNIDFQCSCEITKYGHELCNSQYQTDPVHDDTVLFAKHTCML